MDFDRAFQVLDDLVYRKTQTHLKDAEQFVLQGAWQNQTYEQIADASEYRYTPSYLKKDVGPKLWKRLSIAFEEPVSKTNFRAALERHIQLQSTQIQQFQQPVQPVQPVVESSLATRSDWGEAVDLSLFCGRQQELATLQQWITEPPHCRVVALLGMGGIGKTTLVTQLAVQVQHRFSGVIWRSLRNAPRLEDLLTDLVQFTADSTDFSMAADLGGKLSQLVGYLRQTPYLMVLDNFESLLSSGSTAGQYRSGYENYGELLRLLSETSHPGCLLLTSREKPQEVADREGETLPVRSYLLDGLPEARQLLHQKGLIGTPQDEQDLVDRYSGNPLALKVVATSIQEIFDGNIAEFLAQGTTVFNGIVKLLEQQLQRLTDLEQEILYWLAINREPIGLTELQSDILSPVSKAKLLEALESLVRRSLIDRSAGKFTQQPVVMEYLSDRLIEHLHQELTQAPEIFATVLNRYALLKAQASDYIRENQIRLLLAPLVDRLRQTFGTADGVADRLRQRLAHLQSHHPLQPGYAAGNLLNLLVRLQIDLSGCDLSNLTIRQAYLANVPLHGVNLARSNLSQSVFPEILSGVSDLCFSPDGLFATADTNGDIRLWDITGQQIQTLQGHTRRAWSIAFSADGQTLASGSEDGTVRLWHRATGQCYQTLTDHTGWIVSIAFHPHRSLLITGSLDQTVRIWSISTGHCLQVLRAADSEKARVWSVAPSPDGTLLAAGTAGGNLHLWNLDGSLLQTLPHAEALFAAAWHPNGKWLATGGSDRLIRLWEITSGDCIQTFDGHTGWIVKLQFSKDGETLISSSSDHTLKIWQTADGRCTKTFNAHTGRVVFALNPSEDLIATGSLDQTVKLWNRRTGQCLKTLRGYTNLISSVAFHPDRPNCVATGNSDRTLQLWDLETEQQMQTLQGHTHWILSIAFSPDGTLLASGSSDQTVKLWDSQTGQCLQTLQGHSNRVWTVQFSPTGRYLISGSPDRTIKLWEVSSGRCLNTIQAIAEVFAVTLSADEQTLFGGCEDLRIRLWNRQGDCLQTLEGHTSWVSSLALHPQLPLLASSSEDRTVRLWNLHTGAVQVLEGHTGWVWAVRFSPDGQLLASAGDDQTLKLWNFRTGECLNTLEGHTKRIWSIAFSADGQRLVSGGVDGLLRVWNVATGACIQTLQSSRLCDNLNLAGTTGLTEAQRLSLKRLGAIDR